MGKRRFDRAQLPYKARPEKLCDRPGEATTKTAIANTILLAPSRPYGSETVPSQGSLWEERIELSQPFYELLQKHPVPVYEPAIQRLQNNSAALDVYVWLCYRLHVLQQPTPISWARFKEQFGLQYATTYQFRLKFRDTLALALAVYPDARIKETEAGITLYPWAPAVAKRHLKAVS